MRIQNEGTGKSSWWVLNPDAKPGKTPRRRAGSMETKCYEKKRGRVRKKVEALRVAMENGETLSPVGSDDILDVLTFGDFRSRANSNASSSGRLSPIQSAPEPDLHENQVPPMSPIPWETEVSGSPTLYTSEPYHDLVNSLVVGMKLSSQDSLKMEVTGLTDPFQGVTTRDFSNQSSPYMDISQSSPGVENHYNNLPAPPPYPKQQQQQQMNGLDFHTSNYINPLHLQCSSSPVVNGSPTYSQSDVYGDEFQVLNIKQEPEGMSPVHLATPGNLSVSSQLSSPDRSQQGSPSAFTRLSPQSGLGNGQLQLSPLTLQISPQQSRHLIKQESAAKASLQQQVIHQATHDSILREALTRGPPPYRSQSNANTSPQTYSPMANNHSPLGSASSPSTMSDNIRNISLTLNSNVSPIHQPVTSGQLCGMGETFTNNHSITSNGIGVGCNNNNNNNAGVPLDIDIDLMGMSGLDYDMDQVIKQELTLEGNLDFNFDAVPPASIGRSVVH